MKDIFVIVLDGNIEIASTHEEETNQEWNQLLGALISKYGPQKIQAMSEGMYFGKLSINMDDIEKL